MHFSAAEVMTAERLSHRLKHCAQSNITCALTSPESLVMHRLLEYVLTQGARVKKERLNEKIRRAQKRRTA